MNLTFWIVFLSMTILGPVLAALLGTYIGGKFE